MENSQCTDNINQKILNYSGTNSFMNSIRSQAMTKGLHNLSEKQLAAAEKFFQLKPKPETQDFTYKVGDKICITKWLSRTLAKQRGVEYFFRNLIIEECHAETSKAVQVSVRFDSEITSSCGFCGKGLDNEVSKATGVGPVCAKNYLKIKRPTLENAQEILDKLQEESQIAGVIGPIWVPKSQIRTFAQRVLFEDHKGNERKR